MTDEYISGFFDADGCISMSKSKKNHLFKTIKIDFTNTQLSILLEIKDYLLEKYGILTTISTKIARSENHQVSYTLSASSNQRCYELCKIIKSRHPRKKHRINTVLKYHNIVTKRNGKYTPREIQRKLAYERLFF
jgi:intein-encoded DNA endonuclease-like protein